MRCCLNIYNVSRECDWEICFITQMWNVKLAVFISSHLLSSISCLTSPRSFLLGYTHSLCCTNATQNGRAQSQILRSDCHYVPPPTITLIVFTYTFFQSISHFHFSPFLNTKMLPCTQQMSYSLIRVQIRSSTGKTKIKDSYHFLMWGIFKDFWVVPSD